MAVPTRTKTGIVPIAGFYGRGEKAQEETRPRNHFSLWVPNDSTLKRKKKKKHLQVSLRSSLHKETRGLLFHSHEMVNYSLLAKYFLDAVQKEQAFND